MMSYWPLSIKYDMAQVIFITSGEGYSLGMDISTYK